MTKKAGVSPTTVSFVINDKPGIKASTLALVRKVMNEVGYVPPPPGSAPRFPRQGLARQRQDVRVQMPE